MIGNLEYTNVPIYNKKAERNHVPDSLFADIIFAIITNMLG